MKYVIEYTITVGGHERKLFVQSSTEGAASWNDENKARQVAELLEGKVFNKDRSSIMWTYADVHARTINFIHQIKKEIKCPATENDMREMAKISAQVIDVDAIYWTHGRKKLFDGILARDIEIERRVEQVLKLRQTADRLLLAVVVLVVILAAILFN